MSAESVEKMEPYPGSRFRVLDTITEFMDNEVVGSIILLIATIAALIIANSPLSETYFHLLETHVVLGVGELEFEQSILHLIDDGLMALFFFVIGLEIKREVIVGELSTLRKAALPVVAAVGGMVTPALIYYFIDKGTPGISGWGVPMATDIAFALGVLALLGRRIPVSLKIFLTALAIADDLGAILVIAFFYTSQISMTALAIGGALLVGLIILNRLDVHRTWPYAVLGLSVWLAFLSSGVHATLAGVLVALTIPARSKIDPIQFVEINREMLEQIERLNIPGAHVIEDDSQQHVAQSIKNSAHYMQAPLQRMEHALHPITTYLILPLFALANAGVVIDGSLAETVLTPVGIGVVAGLVLGKPLGIFTATWLAVQTGIARLPAGVTWKHIFGTGLLAGIGFTMSLFISNLAFRSSELLANAKAGVLVASLISGTLGFVFLSLLSVKEEAPQPVMGKREEAEMSWH